jgi:glucose-6-phosphate isomerase
MDRVSLYWKNATADAVGAAHGVTDKELKDLAPRIKDLTRSMAEQRKAGKLAWRDLPYDEDGIDAVRREVEHFRDKCEVLIVLGIGGSALGTIALQQALNPITYNLMSDRVRPGPQLFVLDNVDPDMIRAVVDLVTPKIKKTIVNFIAAGHDGGDEGGDEGGDDGGDHGGDHAADAAGVGVNSRAGNTARGVVGAASAETAAQFMLFRDLLQTRLGKKYKDNILATLVGESGPMHELAKKEGFRVLQTSPGVSGRFGTLSGIGLFGAAVCGIDADAVLAGAAMMDKRVKDADLFNNPAAMLAAINFLLSRKGKPMGVMMPYGTSLDGLSNWYRHLWAESLGKKDGTKKKDVFAGITPVRALGTSDQHSQMQLYREGPNDKFFTFVEVDRYSQKVSIPEDAAGLADMAYLAGGSFQTLIHSEKSAAEFALLQSKRPTMSLTLPGVTPESIGQFFYLYQAAAGYLAGLLDVDAYDAPAVQLPKDAAAALMGKKGLEELAARVKPGVERDKKFLL